MIAVNHSVRSKLDPGDLRRNYILTGTTWFDGVVWLDATAQNGTKFWQLNQAGTVMAANTAIETFVQGFGRDDAGRHGCLLCHDNPTGAHTTGLPDGLPFVLGADTGMIDGNGNSVGLSHIFGQLQPLP